MSRFKKILLALTAVGVASFGLTTVVLASSNPEALQLVEEIAKYSLEGLKEYFKFLLDLFREAVSVIV